MRVHVCACAGASSLHSLPLQSELREVQAEAAKEDLFATAAAQPLGTHRLGAPGLVIAVVTLIPTIGVVTTARPPDFATTHHIKSQSVGLASAIAARRRQHGHLCGESCTAGRMKGTGTTTRVMMAVTKTATTER